MDLLLLSGACKASRPFLLFVLPCHRGGWDCTRNWEGTQPGQVTPNDHRRIPNHMASCSVTKTGRRRRKWEIFRGYLLSPVPLLWDGVLLSWGWVNTCLLIVIVEWIPCFALLVWVAFALLTKLCLYANPQVLFILTAPILLLWKCEGWTMWVHVDHLISGDC